MVGLAFLLFLFNNPWYLISIFHPSMISISIANMQTVLFIAAILIFWLKDIAKFKSKEASPRVNTFKQMARKSLDNSPCMVTVLALFYIILVLDFMALYSLYYIKVKVKPGFSYTHKEDQDKLVTSVLITSLILLAIYYIWYFIAFINHIRLICSADKTTKT